MDIRIFQYPQISQYDTPHKQIEELKTTYDPLKKMISIEVEKLLTKSNIHYDKKSPQSGYGGNVSQHTKRHL